MAEINVCTDEKGCPYVLGETRWKPEVLTLTKVKVGKKITNLSFIGYVDLQRAKELRDQLDRWIQSKEGGTKTIT